MVQLLKFGSHLGLPDLSPFVLKLETYLRMAGIDYEPVHADIRKMPKSKLPCLKLEGQILTDSQLIIEALQEKFGDPLNDGLLDFEKAQHHMLRLGLENHSFFILVAYRWLHDKNALLLRDTLFSKMGWQRKLIFKIVQRDVRRSLYGQGIIRHSWVEIDQMIAQDFSAIEAILGDKPYFGGDQPREIDATLFGFLANMLVPEFDTPQKTLGRQSRALVDYTNRMTERFYDDYKETMLIAVQD